MIRYSRSSLYIIVVIVCAASSAVTAPFASAQSQAAQVQKDEVPEKPSHVQPADVSGDWQVSWQGRLGAEDCLLHLQQDGTKLTGTLKTLHGVSSLSGTVEDKRISFEAAFQGPRPFTTRFTGTANGGKIEGVSQAVGVGSGGAYLGHAGELVQPDHPWTAMRVANPPAKN